MAIAFQAMIPECHSNAILRVGAKLRDHQVERTENHH
jgi:hypothetical protein